MIRRSGFAGACQVPSAGVRPRRRSHHARAGLFVETECWTCKHASIGRGPWWGRHTPSFMRRARDAGCTQSRMTLAHSLVESLDRLRIEAGGAGIESEVGGAGGGCCPSLCPWSWRSTRRAA